MARTATALLLLITALVLAGACASAGRRIDRTHLDDIAVGEQGKSEIRAWFGEPYAMQTNLQGHPSGCTERWRYEYAEAQGFGNVTYQEILVVDFDAAGRVCDHAFSKSGAE